MEFFVRTAAIYFFLLFLFRITGKRTLSDLSTFDFILLLIISEATQNALIDDDRSLVAGMAVILSLVLLDLGLAFLKRHSRTIENVMEGVPVLLVEQGRTIEEHLRKTHVTDSDILQAARQSQGLESMDQIKYAVLETSGGISIVPMEPDIERLLDRRIEAALKRNRENSRGSP